MSEIHEKIEKVRDFINIPWIQCDLIIDKTIWNKICSSLDVLEDTQEAIYHFYNLPEFSGHEGYLYLYGLLQAFFLQQDALNSLYSSFFNKSINWKDNFEDLYNIRQIRNKSIGHPTNKGNNESFHYISRQSISNKKFMLMSFYTKSKEVQIKEIFLDDIRKEQKEVMIKILEEVIEKLNFQNESHIMKFAGKKLCDIIENTNLSYHLEKIQDIFYNSDFNSIKFNLHYPIIKEIFNRITNELKERYKTLDLDNVNNVKQTLDRIQFTISKIESFFIKKEYNIEIEIYFDALHLYINDLKKMLSEIDSDFNKHIPSND